MNFSDQLKELKRKTNLNGRHLAEELGIGAAYFSQLINGKQEPPERAPIRKTVERMLNAPASSPGKRSFVVEIPEGLYISAVVQSQRRLFNDLSDYIAQLIRDDTQAVTTIQTAQQTGPGAQNVTGIQKRPSNSGPKR